MLIIGVDPGSVTTGYGVVRKERASSVHVTSGVIRSPASDDHPRRLARIFRKLDEVMRACSPDVMVVESLFHADNSQSLMKLSQARGVVLLLGELHNARIFEYSPLEIKRGLTGYGRAEKDQMVFMVGKILKLPKLKSADEADALAMALYHSHLSLPERCAL